MKIQINVNINDCEIFIDEIAIDTKRKERGELEFTLSEAFTLAIFFETTVDSLFADRKALIK